MCRRSTEVMCKYYIVSYRGREHLWIWISIRGRGMTGFHILRIPNDNSSLNVPWALLRRLPTWVEPG